MKHKQSQRSFALCMIAIGGAHSKVPDLENVNPPWYQSWAGSASAWTKEVLSQSNLNGITIPNIFK